MASKHPAQLQREARELLQQSQELLQEVDAAMIEASNGESALTCRNPPRDIEVRAGETLVIHVTE